MSTSHLSIAQNFTRYPAGRYKSDGPYSGEQFREDFLVPVMEKGEPVTIDLDGVRGFGSSFLEEAFGGLVRKGYSPESVLSTLTLKSSDPSLAVEIEDYVRHGADGDLLDAMQPDGLVIGLRRAVTLENFETTEFVPRLRNDRLLKRIDKACDEIKTSLHAAIRALR